MLLYSNIYIGLPNDLFSSDFPTKILYSFLIFPLHATNPVHLITLYLFTVTVFNEMYIS